MLCILSPHEFGDVTVESVQATYVYRNTDSKIIWPVCLAHRVQLLTEGEPESCLRPLKSEARAL